MTKIPYQHGPECPVYDVFNLLSKRGVMLILKAMGEGHHQFCQIKSSCYNINNKSLTDKLQELIDADWVEKKKTDQSTYESYYLTERGRGIAELVGGIAVWSKQ